MLLPCCMISFVLHSFMSCDPVTVTCDIILISSPKFQNKENKEKKKKKN